MNNNRYFMNLKINNNFNKILDLNSNSEFKLDYQFIGNQKTSKKDSKMRAWMKIGAHAINQPSLVQSTI